MKKTPTISHWADLGSGYTVVGLTLFDVLLAFAGRAPGQRFISKLRGVVPAAGKRPARLPLVLHRGVGSAGPTYV